MKHHHSRLLPFYVSIAIVVGVLVGSFYGRQFSGSRVSFISTSSNKLSDLLHIINERYVDTVNMADLVEKAMPQILRELDPHSTYISAKDVEASMQDLKGSFSGIGIQFTIYNDTIRVVRIIEGGPSESVGLRAGDRIVTIDGKTFVGKSVTNEETMKRLKGAANTTIKLGIKRSGEKELLSFSIVRGDVPVKSIDVAYLIDAKTGYIRINTWGDNTYPEFLANMASLNAQGMTKLVVDLRGNLGGYLQAAVQVANEFLPKGSLIVYNEGRRFPREDYRCDGRGAYQSMPLIVLVDETSASASEIFAGAMQDNDRATIVGRRTFGKGLVQVPIQFHDKSMLRLTIARYYTPSGRSLQKPFTPGDEEAYEADLFERALTGEYYNPDSIKTSGKKYKTRIGRTVYGGGGIIPDYFIARDTLGFTTYYKDVYLSGTMFNFAYGYVDENRKSLLQLKTSAAIAKHLRSKDIVEMFATYADKHGHKRRNLMIRTSRQLLERNLIGLILNDVLNIQASVQYNNESDPFILEAQRIFQQDRAFPSNSQTEKGKGLTSSYDVKERNQTIYSPPKTRVAFGGEKRNSDATLAQYLAKSRRFLFGKNYFIV